MKGRTEHAYRTRNNIKQLLEEMPKEVTDFYYIMQTSREPLTCLEYVRKINHFIKFAGTNFNKIDEAIVGKYFELIKDTNDSCGNIKESSFAYQKVVWTSLNHFFTYLSNKGVILENPMKLIERPKYDDNVKRIFISMDDLNSILHTVQTGAGSKKAISRQKKWKERDLLIMFLFMNTGMRKTALSEINVEDISFHDKSLIVIDKRRTQQVYDISNEMEQAITTWLSKREELLDGTECEALFITGSKTRISEKAIYNLVQKYSEEALGYAISPHKLRGAFISLYFKESGNDIESTRKAVGHKSVATTSRYISSKNNPRTEAINFMSKNLKV